MTRDLIQALSAMQNPRPSQLNDHGPRGTDLDLVVVLVAAGKANAFNKYPRESPMRSPTELRSLATRYREFAERTGNPTIWECRLKTAEDLEQEAGRIEAKIVNQSVRSGGSG